MAFPKCMYKVKVEIANDVFRGYFLILSCSVLSAVLYALAKQGRTLGAYKLARLVYEKLHTMHIPSRYRTSIEIGALTIRAKPFSDAEVRVRDAKVQSNLNDSFFFFLYFFLSPL